MFTTLFSTALVAAIGLRGAMADSQFTVATPQNFTQCASEPITWNGGVAPYSVWILLSSDVCAEEPLVDLGDHTVTHIHWIPAISANSSVTVSVLDANNDETWTGSIPVVPGDNATCLPANLLTDGTITNSSSSSSASSASITPTTLVVPPPVVAPEAAPSSSASVGSGSGPTPQGASGSGMMSSGANARYSAPIVTIIAGVAAFIYVTLL